MVSCPLLTPQTFLCADTSEMCSETGGIRGHDSGRLSAYGTLYCPEFTLRDLPRITVRGQTVQGAGLALRKAPLRSRAYPWSTRRPCGPLAFRRATVGSRVQRRVWGVKRGKGTIGALSPLVSAARRWHSPAVDTAFSCPSAAIIPSEKTKAPTQSRCFYFWSG